MPVIIKASVLYLLSSVKNLKKVTENLLFVIKKDFGGKNNALKLYCFLLGNYKYFLYIYLISNYGSNIALTLNKSK